MNSGVGVQRQEHPKTHESNRVLGVPQFAADVIHQRMALLDPEDTGHLLFYSRVGTPLTPYNVRCTFRAILRNAGLEGMDIIPHSFRRAGATLSRQRHTSTTALKTPSSPMGSSIKPADTTTPSRRKGSPVTSRARRPGFAPREHRK